MLVLGRKQGEGLVIGENIRVVIIKSGGRVQLGVEAPKNISIRRDELNAKGKSDD